jgi:hypothetical protein
MQCHYFQKPLQMNTDLALKLNAVYSMKWAEMEFEVLFEPFLEYGLIADKKPDKSNSPEIGIEKHEGLSLQKLDWNKISAP